MENIGKIDAALRLLFLVVVAIMIFFNVISGYLAIGLLFFSSFLFLFAITSSCPVYNYFGFSSIFNKQCDKQANNQSAQELP